MAGAGPSATGASPSGRPSPQGPAWLDVLASDDLLTPIYPKLDREAKRSLRQACREACEVRESGHAGLKHGGMEGSPR
jgi:hypothetical protein